MQAGVAGPDGPPLPAARASHGQTDDRLRRIFRGLPAARAAHPASLARPRAEEPTGEREDGRCRSAPAAGGENEAEVRQNWVIDEIAVGWDEGGR